MDSLFTFFSQYGLLAMFVLILAEYACFPVSSEIVLPFAGAYAAALFIPFPLILSLSILAGITGTTLCFLLGKWGGTLLLNRISERFPKTRHPLSASFRTFERYGVWAVGVGRVIPLCRTYVAFVAGALGQPYTTFLPASALGISVWNSVLIGIGYFLGENRDWIVDCYKSYRDLILLLLLLGLLFFLFRHISKRLV